MNLSTLVSLAGVPGLEPAFTLLTTTYAGIENVKLYKQQCQDMSARCMAFLIAIQENSRGLEGTRILEILDELEPIIQRINRQVREWGSWNRLKSFLQQRDIKDGIDRLHRDIDSAMVKFNIQMNMEMSRGQLESQAIRERDNAEIREVLQIIVNSQEDMKTLLNMETSRDSRPVEEMMASLQTQLMDPHLQPNQEETFREGLWMLHETTSKLPPLTDMSGQITLSDEGVIARGYYNDIYKGHWLDKEPVALRLPKALANSPEVQDRFEREVAIWRELDHPNIVPLYGIVYIREDLYSVTPWMDNRTIVHYVKRFPSVDRLQLISGVASGLEYLHHRGIVHGDLRAANVLISKDGVARLSDFGLSKFLEDCGKQLKVQSNAISPRWSAPELVRQDGPLSMHSDVWSFAMVCLEILSGDPPFGTAIHDDVVRHELELNRHPDRPGRIATSHGLDSDVWKLMCRCWSKKPGDRPSISTVKASLLEIRGLVAPIDTKPTSSKRLPSFTFRKDNKTPNTRPSTAESQVSAMSATSSHRRMTTTFTPSNGIPEQTMPISIAQSASGSYGMSERSDRPRQGSSSSWDYGAYGDHHGSPSLGSPTSPVSASRIPSGGAPRLETPHFSLPTQLGSHLTGDFLGMLDHRSVSPIRSTISSDSGVQLSDPVRDAVANPRYIIKVLDGAVSSGTLEGLVQFLIKTFNYRRDIEFRDILLTACADFSSPRELFEVLSRQFDRAGSEPGQHPEDRVAVQYNVFMIISYWLTSGHFAPDYRTLWKMNGFCESAIRGLSARMMIDRASDLSHLIEVQLRKHLSPSPTNLLPSRKVPPASQIKPYDLAVGLTLLEGDKYKALVPSDYIIHLAKRSGPTNIVGAYTTNNKIITWVKDSILHYDMVEHRANVLKFFIHTAHECRKMRNFSSLAAITTALHSEPIESLKLTKAALTLQMQSKLDALYDIIDPAFNHRGYRDAINEATTSVQRDHCIPWLAVHLKELRKVLQIYPISVEVEGSNLINFQRYVKFMDRIKEVVHYKPPDLEQFREHGQLAYLENQLRNLRIAENTDDELLARSQRHRLQEASDYRTRKPQLKTLGFRV